MHTELGNFMELNFLEKIVGAANVDLSSAAFLKLFLMALGSKAHPVKGAEK